MVCVVCCLHVFMLQARLLTHTFFSYMLRSQVACLNKTNGNMVWKTSLFGDYAGDYEMHVGGGVLVIATTVNYFVTFDAVTGTERWMIMVTRTIFIIHYCIYYIFIYILLGTEGLLGTERWVIMVVRGS